MLPYTAYLRVYEPVTAFPPPLRSVWTAYAESSRRPRRVQALAAEHDAAVRRLAAASPLVAPDAESPHAYVRRAGGMLYVCPWQTRLRSWLAFARFREDLPPGLSGAFVPEETAERAAEEFERWRQSGRTLHPHISSSTWHVPLTWFTVFDPAERHLLLGDGEHGGAGHEEPGEPRGPAGAWIAASGGEHAESGESNRPTRASSTRTLIYVTTMREARRRLERARRLADGGPGPGPEPGRLDALARRLAEFHPSALVELDYGGLVRLVDDAWLRADESVRETAVALTATERGEPELALAMYRRLRARWGRVRALESAN